MSVVEVERKDSSDAITSPTDKGTSAELELLSEHAGGDQLMSAAAPPTQRTHDENLLLTRIAEEAAVIRSRLAVEQAQHNKRTIAANRNRLRELVQSPSWSDLPQAHSGSSSSVAAPSGRLAARKAGVRGSATEPDVSSAQSAAQARHAPPSTIASTARRLPSPSHPSFGLVADAGSPTPNTLSSKTAASPVVASAGRNSSRPFDVLQLPFVEIERGRVGPTGTPARYLQYTHKVRRIDIDPNGTPQISRFPYTLQAGVLASALGSASQSGAGRPASSGADVDSRQGRASSSDHADWKTATLPHATTTSMNPQVVPAVRGLPVCSTYVTIKENFYKDDDKKLRFVPWFGDNDNSRYLDPNLYELEVDEDTNHDANADSYAPADEMILLQTLKRHGDTPLVWEALSNELKQTVSALRKWYRELSGEREVELQTQEQLYRTRGYDATNTDVLMESYETLFCRRCYIYDCRQHSKMHPRPPDRCMPSDSELLSRCLPPGGDQSMHSQSVEKLSSASDSPSPSAEPEPRRWIRSDTPPLGSCGKHCKVTDRALCPLLSPSSCPIESPVLMCLFLTSRSLSLEG